MERIGHLSAVLRHVNHASGTTFRTCGFLRPIILAAIIMTCGLASQRTLAQNSPVVVSITMTQDGNAVTAAAPGSTIVLSLQVLDANPGPLKYRWTSNLVAVGRASDADPASAWVTLPVDPVTPVVFVEITNSNGGVTRGSIKIPLTTASSPQRPLEFIKPLSSAFINPGNITLMGIDTCKDETKCEAEAKAYYKKIGALDDNENPRQTGTFSGWKSFYGFSDTPTAPAPGEVRAVFYNNADLQFGRDMHCRSDSSDAVACYVSNYGDEVLNVGSDPQKAIIRATFDRRRIATVAMVYDKTLDPYGVQFYVFDDVSHDGKLLTTAILDTEGHKNVPGVCLACHGGSYDSDPDKRKVREASFLPFDAPSYIFSTTDPNLSESAQREAIRRLNQMVKTATYARPTISQLIDGWYQWCGGVGKSGCYIDDIGHPFYPNQQPCPADPNDQRDVSCGWPVTWGGALAQSFYQSVPRRYCRACHIAQADRFNVNSFTDWKKKAHRIQYPPRWADPPMPYAEVPHRVLQQDFQAQSALRAFLGATGP